MGFAQKQYPTYSRCWNRGQNSSYKMLTSNHKSLSTTRILIDHQGFSEKIPILQLIKVAGACNAKSLLTDGMDEGILYIVSASIIWMILTELIFCFIQIMLISLYFCKIRVPKVFHFYSFLFIFSVKIVVYHSLWSKQNYSYFYILHRFLRH